jgi:hypothetical protein
MFLTILCCFPNGATFHDIISMSHLGTYNNNKMIKHYYKDLCLLDMKGRSITHKLD